MKLILYWNTIKYLKPIQITGRIRHRLSKYRKLRSVSYKEQPRRIHLFITELDSDKEYIERLKPELLLENRISLLNHERTLTFKEEDLVDETPLWKFNLHYFEYLIGLAVRYKETNSTVYITAIEKIFDSYIESNPFPATYAASLQITNLLIVLDILDDNVQRQVSDKIYHYLYKIYRRLLAGMEVHLLGNHYYENLKAVIFASYVFNESKVYDVALKKLKKQTQEQFLPDGMHFELSPMYHKIMLENLIRITCCFNETVNMPKWLYDTIQRAINALAYLEEGVERTPLFNDAGDNVSKSYKQLLSAAKRLYGIEPERISGLQSAGYYRLNSSNISVLVDVGEIGPDYLPGHGQCDCLSFELYIKGNPLFVNSGTYQYQGKLRNYFRSTSAHNTVKIGNTEQSECWKEHRVGRRIHNINSKVYKHSIKGSYDNYKGNKHEREITLENQMFIVLDKTNAEGSMVHSFLHISNSYHTKIEKQKISVMKDDKTICTIVPVQADIIVHTDGELIQYAPEFGRIYKTECIEFYWKSDKEKHGYIIEFFE